MRAHAKTSSGRSASGSGCASLLGWPLISARPHGRCGRWRSSRPARATTADELAERLGVTERAARRYVGILREAGIPVESIRGPHGGYRLGRGTRLPPVVFTEAEALGLVMAVLDGQPSAADGDDLVGSALGKVIQALPDNVGRQAAALREHAVGRARPVGARPDPAHHQRAGGRGRGHRRVRVTYRSETGNEWDAEVDPWAVVVRYGRWYLLCHSHRADGIRTYRIDRVRVVEPTGPGSSRPTTSTRWPPLEENLGTGWEFPTRVVFDAPRGRGGALDPPAHGPARTVRRRLRARRQHAATRRCTRRSGWPTCRSPSASRAGRSCVPRSRPSRRVLAAAVSDVQRDA